MYIVFWHAIIEKNYSGFLNLNTVHNPKVARESRNGSHSNTNVFGDNVRQDRISTILNQHHNAGLDLDFR